MTLDRLNRADAMAVLKMFYELEEQVDIRNHNIFVMREHLKKYSPQNARGGVGSFIVKSYFARIIIYFSFVALFVLGVFLRAYFPDMNETLRWIIIGIFALCILSLCIVVRKKLKKRKKEKFIQQNKGDFEHWTNSLNKDIEELNKLKPAIAAEYNKFNIAPEYRNGYSMHAIYKILYYNSSMSVSGAIAKFDADERARSMAEAHIHAGQKVADTISAEAEKTRKTINENARKEQEVTSAMLNRLNDFYFYR